MRREPHARVVNDGTITVRDGGRPESDLFIGVQVTGFGVALSAGGDIFGGSPVGTSGIFIDYNLFINDLSLDFWATGQPQLTHLTNVNTGEALSCRLVKDESECGEVTFDHGVPLSDDDLAPVNIGNEEMILKRIAGPRRTLR